MRYVGLPSLDYQRFEKQCPHSGGTRWDFSLHPAYEHWLPLPSSPDLTLSVINEALDAALTWNLSDDNITPYGIPRLIREMETILPQMNPAIKAGQPWVRAMRGTAALRVLIDPII